MTGAALQRFAILLALVGGILHLEKVTQQTWGGLTEFGLPIVFLAVILGFVGVTIEIGPTTDGK